MPGASGAEGRGAEQLPLQAVVQTKAQHCACRRTRRIQSFVLHYLILKGFAIFWNQQSTQVDKF